MKLQKFKEKDNKKVGVIGFTIICILLVSGVVLYRTFAIFEVKTHQNVIKGTVQDPGNLYFAFYVDDKIEKKMPQKDTGYIFDEESSYCGVTGSNDDSITLEFDKDRWSVTVLGLEESRTKCNLHFVKGAYILGKPVKAVTSGDGLYEVTHKDSALQDGFKRTEFRYAGLNPNNYINFNEELWRIIGLVNVKTNDGTIVQKIKIIRDQKIGDYSWDYGDGKYENDWTKASLMEMLNGIYYNGQQGKCYKGNSNPNDCDFSQTSNVVKGLKEQTRKMIDEDVSWNIGGTNKYVNALVKNWYEYERGTETFSDQPSEWKKEEKNNFHSIGLIYPSDYGYATNGGTLGREDGCFSKYLYDWKNAEWAECSKNDWLKKNDENLWTISPRSLDGTASFSIYSINADHLATYVNNSSGIKPAVYLKPEVYITSGTGELTSAFELSME